MALPRRERVDSTEAFDEIKRKVPEQFGTSLYIDTNTLICLPEVRKDLYFCTEIIKGSFLDIKLLTSFLILKHDRSKITHIRR